MIWNTVQGIPQLIFKTEIEIEEGKPQVITVMIQVPVFVEKHRSWDPDTRTSKIVEGPNLAQTGRILLNILKGQLSAIAGGVMRFEEVFLSDIAVDTPRGPQRFVDVLRDKKFLGERGLQALPETVVD